MRVDDKLQGARAHTCARQLNVIEFPSADSLPQLEGHFVSGTTPQLTSIPDTDLQAKRLQLHSIEDSNGTCHWKWEPNAAKRVPTPSMSNLSSQRRVVCVKELGHDERQKRKWRDHDRGAIGRL